MRRKHVFGIAVGATTLTLAVVVFSERSLADRPPSGSAKRPASPSSPYGVCPPFKLRDEQGNVIDPVQGKIHPVNRIHSAWPGIEIEGQTGLMQPRMSDVVKMWTDHRADPSKYPALAKIVDDRGDGVPEVNRPEEIEALIASVTEMLAHIKYPMDGKRVVWVMNDRVYRSGTEYRTIDKHEWEASPFANVHKYSHDVFPARSALGAGGCIDCHRVDSPFFDRPILAAAFDPTDGQPQWVPNYTILGISRLNVLIGGIREQWLKPILYGLLALVLAAVVSVFIRGVALHQGGFSPAVARTLGFAVLAGALITGVIATPRGDLLEYMTVSRFNLDANHFGISCLILLVGLVLALRGRTAGLNDSIGRAVQVLLWATLVFTAACGGLILLNPGWLQLVVKPAYTGLDLGLVLLAMTCLVALVRELATLQSGTEPVLAPGGRTEVSTHRKTTRSLVN